MPQKKEKKEMETKQNHDSLPKKKTWVLIVNMR